MKKLVYIFALGVLLSACSAQQRLNRLLSMHPELHYIDTVVRPITVVIRDTIIQAPDTNSINLSLNDILHMDSMANNGIKEDVQVNTTQSGASLQALGDGQFQLNTFTKPDTIIIKDTICKDVPVPVPSYITTTEIKEVEVYKMTWYQKAFAWIGVIMLVLLLIAFAVRIAFKS